jgi:hypothetical protein
MYHVLSGSRSGRTGIQVFYKDGLVIVSKHDTVVLPIYHHMNAAELA